MSDESSREFNRRLSQWVASQGIWFQMRHAAAVGGGRGQLLFQTLRLGVLVCLLLMLSALAFWLYLHSRISSESFSKELHHSIQLGLSAKDLSLRDISYADDQLNIPRIAAEGGSSTFYESLMIYNLSCDMALLETRTGDWSDGVVTMGKMEILLREGADDERSAAAISKILFDPHQSRKIKAIEVADANLEWGFSKATRGSISGSRMLVQRAADGWRVNFKGGTFSQNWLHELEIVELIALCEPSRIVFEKAAFAKNGGSITMNDLEIESGVRPKVDGILQVRSLDLSSILPAFATPYVEGSISGDFKVSGSPNRPEGIAYDGEVVLGSGDRISLKDEIALLAALSVMDYSRSYHRIDFEDGRFGLKSGAGRFEVHGIDLRASRSGAESQSKLSLEGGFQASPPSPAEIKQAIKDGLINEDHLPAQYSEIVTLESLGDSLDEEAWMEFASEASASNADESALFNRLSIQRDARRLQSQVADKLSSLMRYEGSCEITIPGNAFERAGELRNLHPADAESGRIRLKVPLSGRLSELTTEQTQEMYEQGRR